MLHITLNYDDAKAIANALQCCISTETTRYYLNGIYFNRKAIEATLETVATDGHRMGIYEITPHFASPEDFAFIMPSEAVQWIAKAKRQNKLISEQFSIEYDAPRLTLIHHAEISETGEYVMEYTRGFFKEIDGTWPDHMRVLPYDARTPLAAFNAGYVSEIAKAMQKVNSSASFALSENAGGDGPAWLYTDIKGLKYVIMPKRADIETDKGIEARTTDIQLLHLSAQLAAVSYGSLGKGHTPLDHADRDAIRKATAIIDRVVANIRQIPAIDRAEESEAQSA